MSTGDVFDLLIVGGGINGAGIARDAAGRGLRVLLCEMEDLGWATSSASSKLIHGGLRYLETYELRLVRESLAEREVLLRMAPHIVRPLRFVLPHNALYRPAWMIRLGLMLYDHLGGRRTLPGTTSLKLAGKAQGAPLKPELTRGFEYSDCQVDDSRLVLLNALDARARGAEILPRTECTAARRMDGGWQATLRGRADGAERAAEARILVNAAGPWVGRFLKDAVGGTAPAPLKLVKGSHIVVPKLYDGDHAYILQNVDRRVVFAIPYHHHFTLIGTTDLLYEGDPGAAAITPEETEYLCDVTELYFRNPVSPEDVVWAYSGVRPLYDNRRTNPSTITRDYVFDVDAADGRAPLLSIYGGKITTYRRLAEQAIGKLALFLRDLRPDWTSGAVLPGGGLPAADPARYLTGLKAAFPFLPHPVAERYAAQYGTLVHGFLDGVTRIEEMGINFGGGLYEREVAYLCANEWARTADDILWRRTKLGLIMPPEGREKLAIWLAGHLSATRAA